jgi:hypothetical protein
LVLVIAKAKNMMDNKPNVATWMALLGASRNHGNVERGGVIKWVLELELENAPVYLLLTLNIARRMMFLFHYKFKSF